VFQVQGLECRVLGLGLRVLGFVWSCIIGFRVWCFRFRV